MAQDVFRDALRTIMEVESQGSEGIEGELYEMINIAVNVLAQYDSKWFESYKRRIEKEK